MIGKPENAFEHKFFEAGKGRQELHLDIPREIISSLAGAKITTMFDIGLTGDRWLEIEISVEPDEIFVPAQSVANYFRIIKNPIVAIGDEGAPMQPSFYRGTDNDSDNNMQVYINTVYTGGTQFVPEISFIDGYKLGCEKPFLAWFRLENNSKILVEFMSKGTAGKLSYVSERYKWYLVQ